MGGIELCRKLHSTNFFIVRKGEVWTSTGRFSFKGITRSKVIELFSEAGGVVRQQDFTLAETYAASEAFVTGTLAGITPVCEIDGRTVGDGRPGPVTRKISDLYKVRVLA